MAEPEVQDHNSPAAVTVMTTEHFVLQTARSAGIAEVSGPGSTWRPCPAA